MRDPLERILMLLAAARISMQEMNKLVSFARSNPKELLSHYRGVVHSLEGKERNQLSDWKEDESELQVFTSIYRDIDYLLRNSKLSRAMAARQIAKELVSMGGWSERALRFLPGSGFESWLRKVFKEVGGAALIRATSIVVDRHVRRPKSDWPLSSS